MSCHYKNRETKHLSICYYPVLGSILFLNMIRSLLLSFCVLISFCTAAQRQFPKLNVKIDSLFNICQQKSTSDEQKFLLLSQVDNAVDPYQEQYPLFRGMIYMYQAYHAPASKTRISYHQKGVGLIRTNKKFLADSFASQCYQLLGYYISRKRIDEWLPVDSVLRSVVTDPNSNFEAAILTYANKKMQQGFYRIADDLAWYDILFSESQFASTTDHRLARIFSTWISLNSRYKEWLKIPYYNRTKEISREDFTDLFTQLNSETDSLVNNNIYGDNNFIPYRRTLFFQIYKEAVLAYADWSINDHREGQAILPLKDFLFNRLLPKDVEPALKANVNPTVSCADISNLHSKLAELYINMGNGKEASAVAKAGIEFIAKFKQCTEAEVSGSTAYLFYLRTKADRLQGKYESALRRSDLLKKWYPRPKMAAKAEMDYWYWFIEARLQEVYTLLAQKKTDVAADSLNILLEALSPIGNDSVSLLETSTQWPQLQFVTMQYMARRGKWEIARDYSLEALRILEQDNHWENAPFYYDLQLLYFVAEYRTEKVLLKHVLHNMLFYTGRHLQHTFFMLTPEDRIRLYEQKLSVYFDVYHEILMSGLVDDDTALKKKMIDQSLYLKNALVDANLLPTEALAKSKEMRSIVEDIRDLRNRSNLTISRYRMLSQEDLELSLSDGAQLSWLTVLQNANLDSLAAFTGWKKIAATLKSNQVYVEAVRYTRWLTDSASVYSAYVISNNQLKTVQLFNEQAMLKLLKDPAASPQSGVLSATNTRGLTLTKKDTTVKKFKPGSEDKIGTLVLSSLWQYLSAKNELLIVPDGLLNRISIAALEYQHKPLFSTIKLKQLSGSYVLHQKQKDFPQNGKALLAGGLNYGDQPAQSTTDRLLATNYSWQYLPATKKEVDDLLPTFKSAGENVTVFSGVDLHDSLINKLSEYNFIHLATHGFYVDSSAAKNFYSKRWNLEAVQNDPMMRCGIAVSHANFPDPDDTTHSEGHLLGFELANTDLRKCYLITLSACETGLGDLRNNLGVDGLSRALKLGGARFLLISLWKVPDEPTAVFMQQFYKALFRLKDPAAALQSTQLFMSKKYSVSDWAAFVLVE